VHARSANILVSTMNEMEPSAVVGGSFVRHF
jgi:hypothetical protein